MACAGTGEANERRKVLEAALTFYGSYGEKALEQTRRLLGKLREGAREAGERWEKVLEVWRRLEHMEAGNGTLPEDLPEPLCLVVLGFQLNPDGSMRAELVERLKTALRCARQVPGARILCSGGGTAGNSQVTEAGQMTRWLRETGIAGERLIEENRSLTTAQNAVCTCRLLRERYPEVRNLALVTSDYHIPTGMLVFGAWSILCPEEAGHLRVIAHASCPGGREPLSRMFQAAALLELAGDRETAFRIYRDTYHVHSLPEI